MTERAKELVIIMVIILVLFAGVYLGAYLIAGWVEEDLEAKNIAVCPSDEYVHNYEVSEPNDPIEAQIAERDYRAMKENAK